MDQSTEVNKIADALNKFQGQLTPVTKDSKANAGQFSYSYADLATIQKSIQKPLADNGLAYTQSQTSEKLFTKILHTSGQWLVTEIPAVVDANGRLKGAQAIGSANTYAKRYGLCQALGIPTEDDDGNAGSNFPKSQTHNARPPAVGSNKPSVPVTNAPSSNLETWPVPETIKKFAGQSLGSIPSDKLWNYVEFIEDKGWGNGPKYSQFVVNAKALLEQRGQEAELPEFDNPYSEDGRPDISL